MQWLYASVCAATVLFVWLVVPETQGRTSEQIESFFEHHVLYMGRARRRDAGQLPVDAKHLEVRADPEGAAAGSSLAPGRPADVAAGDEACVTRL